MSTESAEPATIHDYLRSDAFQIAAFKGEGLSFRQWNQQLRQPILLVNPRVLVSVSRIYISVKLCRVACSGTFLK